MEIGVSKRLKTEQKLDPNEILEFLRKMEENESWCGISVFSECFVKKKDIRFRSLIEGYLYGFDNNKMALLALYSMYSCNVVYGNKNEKKEIVDKILNSDLKCRFAVYADYLENYYDYELDDKEQKICFDLYEKSFNLEFYDMYDGFITGCMQNKKYRQYLIKYAEMGYLQAQNDLLEDLVKNNDIFLAYKLKEQLLEMGFKKKWYEDVDEEDKLIEIKSNDKNIIKFREKCTNLENKFVKASKLYVMEITNKIFAVEISKVICGYIFKN